MAEKIAIGLQNFDTIRRNHLFYIDKTDFIKQWWEKSDQVTLITRPRRFGKTLNMSMLECFFSDRYEGQGGLFEGLSIWKNKEYHKIQGTYPVVSLSFAGVKADNYEGAVYQVWELISQVYDKFPMVKKDKLLEIDNETVKRELILDEMRGVHEANLAMLLHSLCRQLFIYYGKKVIIFLDEYDTPMQEAYVYGYWDKMTRLFRNLFHNTFKSNEYLDRAVITGITRISKESVFSDLNNLNVITATSDEYETAFGFTQEEVFRALEEQGLGEKKETVKEWYDGFVFGTARDIYNPWSIINFLREQKFKAYWVNTSSNGLVGNLLRTADAKTKQTMEELLSGNPFFAELDEQIVYNQLDTKKNAIWSLFVAAGYLKVQNFKLKENGRYEYELAITNKEVQLMFEDLITGWFDDGGNSYNDFVKALLAGNRKEMNVYMNEVALDTFSSFDSGKRPSGVKQPERFYHGFVLGLLVELRGDYLVKSNGESGYGRYDVMLEPLKPELPAIVIEFKVHEEGEEDTLKDTVEAALKQIEEKEYDAVLLAKGIEKERICHYGFAFEGKKVLIG